MTCYYEDMFDTFDLIIVGIVFLGIIIFSFLLIKKISYEFNPYEPLEDYKKKLENLDTTILEQEKIQRLEEKYNALKEKYDNLEKKTLAQIKEKYNALKEKYDNLEKKTLAQIKHNSYLEEERERQFNYYREMEITNQNGLLLLAKELTYLKNLLKKENIPYKENQNIMSIINGEKL